MWNIIKWHICYAINQTKKAPMPAEIFICQPTWYTILLILSLGNLSNYKNYLPISTTRTDHQKHLFFSCELSLFYICTMLKNWHKDLLAKAEAVPTYYKKFFFIYQLPTWQAGLFKTGQKRAQKSSWSKH